MAPKTHIEALYQERVTNTLWCQSQLDVANFASGSLQGRFLNELLQNTDDASGVKIEFQLNGRTLIITHDGRPFVKDDVDKIVAFANQRIRNKTGDPEMAGYKGIGFKALLAMASKVHIISGGYSFRFDKAHWESPMPWEMIPIWTESDRPSVHKVAFIFELNDPKTVKLQLDQFCQEPHPMLFLRHVRTIEISAATQKRMVSRKDSAIRRMLIESGVIRSDWMIKTTEEITIPAPVHDAVQVLNTTLCPDRLKKAETVKLTFAFLLLDKTLARPPEQMEVEIFSTLPTKVRLGLPFAVNGEFILETQREQLVESPWNDFLFECLASLQFSFLSEFARSDQWEHLLHVLGPRSIPWVEKNLRVAYENGFKKGYITTAWIPSFLDPKNLLKLHECCVDTTGFYSRFKTHLPPDLIPRNLVHSGLQALDKLGKLVLQLDARNYLDQRFILNQLETIFKRKKDLALCYQLLIFFQTWEWVALKEKVWIPTEQVGLGKLSELSLPPLQTIPLPPPFVPVPVMHQGIFVFDEGGRLRAWLETQGVRSLTAKNIVGKYIVPFIQEKGFTPESSVALVRYLFQLYCEEHIDEKDLKKLQDLPILTVANSLSPIRKLYISKDYDPDQSPDLQTLFPKSPDLFVNPCYMEDPALAPRWLEFFRDLGAQEKCGLVIVEKASVEELRKQNISNLDEFLGHLHKGKKPIIGRPPLAKDGYRNFVFFPMMENLSMRPFALQFWQTLRESGKQFLQTDKSCQFMAGKHPPKSLSSSEKSSYIKYILNGRPCIYGTDGQLHTASELYSPAFRSLKAKELVAADIEVSLSKELLEYLGFKTEISPRECYAFLKKMYAEKSENLDFYIALLKNLTTGWKNLDEREKEELLKLKWHFLAHNNTWQPVAGLSCFAVKERSPSLQSNIWFKNVTPEMEELAKIFNRPIVTEYVNETEIQDPKEDTELRVFLWNKLPLLAWIRAHHLMQPPDSVLKELAACLNNLHLFRVASIPSIEKGSLLIDMALFENRIYYTEKCPKHRRLEKVAMHFNLDYPVIQDIIEILSLKTEPSKSHKKTEEEWISERKIPSTDLVRLRQALQLLDHTPEELTPEKAVADTPAPQDAQPLPPRTPAPQPASPAPSLSPTSGKKDATNPKAKATPPIWRKKEDQALKSRAEPKSMTPFHAPSSSRVETFPRPSAAVPVRPLMRQESSDSSWLSLGPLPKFQSDWSSPPKPLVDTSQDWDETTQWTPSVPFEQISPSEKGIKTDRKSVV